METMISKLILSLITGAAIILWGISLPRWEKQNPFWKENFDNLPGRIVNILCTIIWILGITTLCL